MFRKIALMVLMFFLFGCASNVPKVDPRKDFSLKADATHGRLVAQPFQVPVDEPGVTLLHILGAMGGADLDYPYWANIYDVTGDEVKLLGGFQYAKNQVRDMGKVEQLLPAGRRILMVDRSAAIEPDFLEIDVHPNENTVIGIARSGFSRNAFAVELKIRQEDYEFCNGLRVPVKIRDGGASEVYPLLRDKAELITEYMKQARIDPEAEYFQRFCSSQVFPAYVNEVDAQEFESSKNKAAIVEMKHKYLNKWLASNDRKKPFDVRRDGLPQRQACSNEVRECANGKKVMRTAKNCEFASCDIYE
jgi:hypothetical protein